MESLQDVLVEALDGAGVSATAAARRTTGIHRSTIARIRSGRQRHATPETLEALARAVDVPLRRLRAANGQDPDLPPFRLPSRADALTLDERKVILGMVDALLEARARAE